MNILYFDHYAGSLKYGFEFRPYYLSREWVKQGNKVRVIGGDYSHLRYIQPTVKKDFCLEVEDGIEYQWIKTGKYHGNGVKRVISMLKYSFKLWLHARKIAKDFKPDVVISSSTYPLDSYAGYKIAKIAKGKYIHESHDVWPLTLIELGGISKYNPFVVMLGKAEKNAFKKCGKVVSVLPNTLEHMMEKGLGDKSKFNHIPNGIVLSDWENKEPLPSEHKELFDKLRAEDKIIIGYVGAHGFSNMLGKLLDSAKRFVDDKRLAFVLVGKGNEKQSLIDRVKQENITNIYFLPPIKKTQVPSALEQMDTLYVGAENCSLYRYGVSMNKVYDYMMAGRPILYGVKASNNDVLEAKCGISFDNETEDGLVNAILEFIKLTKNQREEMGNNGKVWVLNNCEYVGLANKFMKVINDCPKVNNK